MKKNAGRLLCLLIAAVMALGLTACGKDKQPADPNLVKIDDYTVLYKGASIMTDDEGNDAIVLTLDYTNNSKDDTAFWVAVYEKAMQGGIQLDTALVYPDPDSFVSITDDKFTAVAPGTTFEVHTSFVLRDAASPVEVTFSDLFEKYTGTITIDPTVLTRVEPKTEQPEQSADPAGETITAEPTGDALLDWWNGGWYGWWIITGADGGYADSSNKWWDCCAQIDIGEDYTGTVIIWDEDLPKDNALSEAVVTLNAAGTGEHGTLTSESGYYLRSELGHADWIVDPGIMNYDNLICIDGWYEDENGSFKYTTYLRPWGTIWDDVEADNPDDLPYYYKSWYLPLVEAGAAMPNELGGEAEATSTEGQNSQDNTGTNAADNANAGNTAEDGEYGKSNAEATGIATLQAMQDLYKICFENRSNAYHLFSYEDAKEALGCDGVVWKKASYSWNETKHTYRWETEDGKDYFNISFALEGDDEWYDSCSMSEKVINGLW